MQMKGPELSPVSFDHRLFYLYGYPTQTEKGGQLEIQSADAHGEELRRRYQAYHTLTQTLERVGARVTTDASEGAAADYVVISDSCSAEQREEALALGLPVINESVLFEQIEQPSSQHPLKRSKRRGGSFRVAGGRLRNSVSMDEMVIYEPNRVETFGIGPTSDDTALVSRPIRSSGSSSTSSSSSSELDENQFLGDLDDNEYRERLEWRDMLVAALTGEVVGSEKKRLISQNETNPLALGDSDAHLLDNGSGSKSQQSRNLELWLSCRAAIRGRTPLQEKQTIESLRSVHADTALRAVMDFCVDRTALASEEAANVEFSVLCLVQLQKLLRRVDYVEGMYPTLQALGAAKPVYASPEFQEKLGAITSWTNISVRLELLYTMIQRWTGSDDLNLYSVSTPGDYISTTAGISKGKIETPPSATQRVFQHTPFVERLLKENGMRKIFEQRILTELEAVMLSARADLIENGALLCSIGLPMFNRQMQELLRFPPRLLQTCLQIRLQTAVNLNSAALAQVDQLIEDVRDSLAVACRVKRSFTEVTKPMSYWNPEVQLDAEYDHTLRSCLKMYFWLLQRKLKITSERGNIKDFGILEAQWPFMLEVVRDIEGGSYEMALQFCQQTRNHLHEWTRVIARLLKGPPVFDTMTSRDLAKWVGRVLQNTRTPILKGQRLVRTIQEAVANSTDYVFSNAHALFARLVDTKHALVYTAGEWETRGLYIFGSEAIASKPHLTRSLLSNCIVDEELSDAANAKCYLLVVRTDAEFSWTGGTVILEEGIQIQDLKLTPGQMRLISPGFAHLITHRAWLEKIGIAGKMAPGDTGTAVTDAILDRYARRRHRQNFRSSQNSNQAFSTKDNDSDDQSDDGDGDDFGDASSDFAALRPSLDPTNRRLRRSTGAAQGESAAKRADHDDSNGPPARVYELTRAHNPLIQKEWTLLKHGIVRLLDALTQIPDMIRVLHLTVHEREYSEKISTEPTCRGAGCDLLNLAQESFSFASNTASRGSRFLDLMAERKVRTAIARMCVSWCGFIAEDCQAGENSTFRWAVQALESTMKLSRHSSTLEVLPRNDWEEIKSHVAGCVTLMISHFDVLGARTAASKHQQHQKQSPGIQMNDPNALLSLDGIGANFRTHLMQRQRVQHAQQADELRDNFLASDGRIGRVLEVTARPEDRTLRLLAASSSNITLRWQIGRYIGGGAFGAVYVGYNLDSGELMAVKEIRLPSRGLGQDSVSDSGAKIVREMEVMSMLQHPNIVTYYGIEVHREKVYLFMELCTRGSLAQLIRDQGRLDEDTVKEYVVQILRGLQYLHGAGICHRDIKCDNTLLDESMCVKLVDFGAAKVLNNHSMAATRRSRIAPEGPAGAAASLTGTPMYMAPEIILGSNGGSTAGGPKSTEMMRPGRLGAMDIWSLGCCIVEMVSGSPPWAHLDNEWAVMYNVVSGNPPLPDPSTISQKGMHFLRRCFTRQPADRPTASELLDDEWIADTIRMLDRREERAQDASNRTGSAGLNGDGDAETEGLLASNIDAISNATPLEEPAARRSINSLGSSGSQTNLLHPRSRTSSINRKNFSGDLRFTPSSTGADAEVLLSMMDHSVESGGSGSIILSSIGDRSPGTLGHHHGTGGTGVRSAMTYVHSPLVRTPGSPHSVHSAHGAAAAAWPFNKDTNSTGMSTAPAVLAEGDQKQAAENVVNIAMSNNSSNSGAALALFSENVATSEELAAIYSHPSVIYQALNDTSADMGSPVGVGGVAQFAVPNAGTVLASSPDALSPTSPPPPSLPQQQKQQRQQPQQEQQHEQHQQLSNDEIHDLSETTRKALSAMLNLPLEGADVAGVSGWLGEGNTPMEMLEAAEVKETVATTSQLVMRQREQQLRQQQDLRQAVHRQHFRNVILRQKISASSSDTQLAQHPHRQQVVADDKLGPLSDSGVETTLAESDVVAGEFENDGEEYPAQQVSEPPALYPLPPSDED